MKKIFLTRFKGTLVLAVIYIAVAFCKRTLLLILAHAEIIWMYKKN